MTKREFKGKLRKSLSCFVFMSFNPFFKLKLTKQGTFHIDVEEWRDLPVSVIAYDRGVWKNTRRLIRNAVLVWFEPSCYWNPTNYY